LYAGNDTGSRVEGETDLPRVDIDYRPEDFRIGNEFTGGVDSLGRKMNCVADYDGAILRIDLQRDDTVEISGQQRAPGSDHREKRRAC
jgi:hypothetical protein